MGDESGRKNKSRGVVSVLGCVLEFLVQLPVRGRLLAEADYELQLGKL